MLPKFCRRLLKSLKAIINQIQQNWTKSQFYHNILFDVLKFYEILLRFVIYDKISSNTRRDWKILLIFVKLYAYILLNISWGQCCKTFFVRHLQTFFCTVLSSSWPKSFDSWIRHLPTTYITCKMDRFPILLMFEVDR